MSARRAKTRAGGFSLIELLVVMGIISLFATPRFAVFGSAADERRRRRTGAAMRTT